MSAIGKKAAIISLGMSCQSSHQIRSNISLLRSLTRDDTLEVKSLPFDWLICPPASATRILSDKHRFPERHELAINVRPFWMPKNTYFWHHFRDDNKAYDLDRHYEDTKKLYLQRWERFDAVTKDPNRRLIVILSNTQNDLIKTERRVGTISKTFRLSEIISNTKLIEDSFGRPTEFIIVTAADRFINDARPSSNVAIFHHSLDQTDWEGDVEQWNNTFSTYFISNPLMQAS